ncbi:hypothetical protein DPMN_036522 [Dreissena polymorpha]|uniref:Uncharacterized protein n=1 Tax=Dreissena polymorpha TaxID=45954 RepID=A0A9D4M9K7_DREPO|nr:hypothetical protein DPMN_036522 [Dreissena polymorpha]
MVLVDGGLVWLVDKYWWEPVSGYNNPGNRSATLTFVQSVVTGTQSNLMKNKQI